MMGAMAKMERKAGQDRISELADDVLCHILSLVTMKEATATSLLSKRWRFLWTMLLCLNIECSKPIMNSHERVNTFLSLRRTEKIRTFRLKCNSHHCCSRYVDEWVCAVIARKVEHVNISLCNCHARVVSFPALFTCTTIITLTLRGCFDFSIPSSVHMPNVKTLHLHTHKFIPFSTISMFFSGSPALQRFYLKWYQHHLEEWKIVRDSQGIRLLHVFKIDDIVIQSYRAYHIMPDYLESRGQNTVKAMLYITVYNNNKHLYMNQIVSSVLGELCHVEFLSLGDFRLETDPSHLNLPQFENLVELRLFLKNADSLFMELPAKCPKLEVLEVNILDDRYGVNQRCRYHFRDGEREHDLSIVRF